jgi:hypothetical protein
MGKSKKGGYPPPQPSTHYVEIVGGKIENKTVAWGDSVVWQNSDNAAYTLVLLEINGKAVPATVMATLTAVGTVGANSPPWPFNWTPGAPPKTPYVYHYGMQGPPKATATVTVQISVGPISV